MPIAGHGFIRLCPRDRRFLEVGAVSPRAVSATGAAFGEGVAVFVIACDSAMQPSDSIPGDGWSGVVPGTPPRSVTFTGGTIEGESITMLAATGLAYEGEPWLTFTNPGGNVRGVNGAALRPFQNMPVEAT